MKRRLIMLAMATAFAIGLKAQETDMSLIPYRQGNLWGFARPDRSIAINPNFDDAKWFAAGYAVVRKGNMYGYIDKEGKLVIPFKFYSAESFHYGYFDGKGSHMEGGKMVRNQEAVLFAGASLKPGGSEVCINTKGEVMSRCPAISSETEANTDVIKTPQKEYGLVNNDGLFDKLVDDYKAPDGRSYYIGSKNNLYGVINSTFDIIVPFENSAITKLSVGQDVYLHVVKNGLHGILAANGTAVIPVENTAVYDKMDGGKAWLVVTRDGKSGIRDFSNNEVLPSKYKEISSDPLGGFVLTAPDNSKGFYFFSGKLVEPRYAAVRLYTGGQYLQVTTNSGKTGYVNADGMEFFAE